MRPKGPEIWLLQPFLSITYYPNLSHLISSAVSHKLGLDAEAGLILLPFGTSIFYVLQAQWHVDSMLEVPRLPSVGVPRHLEEAALLFPRAS